MWLALIPVGVALMFGLLLVPRRAMPASVPLPLPQPTGLAIAAAADHALAETARHVPLAPAVRAFGSALRRFHFLEAQSAQEYLLAEARQSVDAARPEALSAGDDALLALRAVQLESFLAEIRAFESTGEQSEELAAVGGSFVRGMQYEGWLDGHSLLASDGARRALFKEMWNALAGVQDRPPFQPPLDELRALYALYLQHPHPSRSARDALASAHSTARDPHSCEALAAGEVAAVEAWRLERIARLSAIDPVYPALYARGIAHLRRGDYAHAADDLSAWLRTHPDGPFALRAHAYLRAAADGLRAD